MTDYDGWYDAVDAVKKAMHQSGGHDNDGSHYTDWEACSRCRRRAVIALSVIRAHPDLLAHIDKVEA